MIERRNILKSSFRSLPMGLGALCFISPALAADNEPLMRPIVEPGLVFEEVGGFVAVEAEHFFQQTKTDIRAYYRVTAWEQPTVVPNPGSRQIRGASGGAYLKVLPDTRVTHDDPLIRGENFSNEPGILAILHYKIYFNNPGRYYVWVRSYSTGTEDNGVHVGLNGEWVESGQRWQTTVKNRWHWESRQRTREVHRGVPFLLYLDIKEPGEHVINFSMREDGFKFDKFILTTERESFVPPADYEHGPPPRVKTGRLPPAFPIPAGYTE